MIQCKCPECGYCYKVADDLAGKNVLCPECQTRFKVEVRGDDEGVKSSRSEDPSPRRRREPADEDDGRPTRRRRHHDDDEDDDPRRGNAPAPQATGAAAHSLGIASLVLGILALIVSLIPCAGVIGMPLGGLGLLLGGVGLIVALVRGGRGVGFSIAGSAVSLLALVIAGLWLALVGAVSKSASEADKDGPHAQLPERNTPPPAVRDDSTARAGSDGGRKDAPAPDGKERWDNVGNAVQVGDASVGCLQARSTTFSGQHFGERKTYGPLYRRRSGTASLLLKACAVPSSVLNVTGLIVGSQDEQTTSPGRPCGLTCPVTDSTLGPTQTTSRYSTGIAAFATM
jgi:hypothetical protein